MDVPAIFHAFRIAGLPNRRLAFSVSGARFGHARQAVEIGLDTGDPHPRCRSELHSLELALVHQTIEHGVTHSETTLNFLRTGENLIVMLDDFTKIGARIIVQVRYGGILHVAGPILANAACSRRAKDKRPQHDIAFAMAEIGRVNALRLWIEFLPVLTRCLCAGSIGRCLCPQACPLVTRSMPMTCLLVAYPRGRCLRPFA
ncbi:hypothetical protein GDI3596 [Gluconacetobacter diazotrophicus PA1 5]|uniref:Uncharacterized protein n=1 Tax=Gluconacetobacter diazotrophicus (strain ATCC 49037 / DSM 5601 / CCUG 37298 / CIP 103539 / LMG 7603 / PAl5) TaxID=272568 RepID=A9H6S2_GLUDA|nr:hypothetical protein GDI3596 [Gluconacetobacter diazotrophicus PA1 5]